MEGEGADTFLLTAGEAVEDFLVTDGDGAEAFLCTVGVLFPVTVELFFRVGFSLGVMVFWIFVLP